MKHKLSFFVLTAIFFCCSPAIAREFNLDRPLPPSSNSYVIRAGDVLHVSVWKEDQLDREVSVLPDGMIDFPLIGSIKAEGKTTTGLQYDIKNQLYPYIPTATVSVYVKETKGNTVSILGQVAHPGDVVMTKKINVMQALSQAGGLTSYADDDIVILRSQNGVETAITFNYAEVSAGENLASNITLLPGDVIIVPTASLF